MWKTLALSAGIVFAATTAFAQQQPQCNERKNVLDLLANKYKEAPVALGVTNSGGLVEVLTADKGQTWTIIVTTPQGMSCLVAAGEGWRSMDRPDTDPEA
jgi:hypothetical protein